MIIDFNQKQVDQFYAVAEKIKANPERYLNFDTVADFFQADFLAELPFGAVWTATGLDDGAEQFYAKIEFKSCLILITKSETTYVEIKSVV